MAYTVSTIEKSDAYANRCMDALLEREGIRRDRNLDYSCGIFDDGELVATGSCFENTLRCFAVSGERRGENLINQLVSHLVERQYSRGFTHLFVYTKADSAVYFKSLGFYPVIEPGGRVTFLENRPGGFEHYCQALRRQSRPGRQAAVVMNANPFTLGHRHLVETAAKENDHVHVFVLSEDKSLFPADVRLELVRQGLAGISNVSIHESGEYIISSATFPSYFLKDDDDVARSHADLDAQVFCAIAERMGIGTRYLGQESPGTTTAIYNSVLLELLPRLGIECRVLPRLEANSAPIRAGSVRKAIQEGRMDRIKSCVPNSTWQYLCSEAAKPVIMKIREQSNVLHD